jgi:hypothetical protein
LRPAAAFLSLLHAAGGVEQLRAKAEGRSGPLGIMIGAPGVGALAPGGGGASGGGRRRFGEGLVQPGIGGDGAITAMTIGLALAILLAI